ncbi:hypothetical protein CA13_68090 [Planctomycetes bacterium CA13]|uniref:3-keto-alpha-glucoside-1,2-lyase/3-keto-2-hydroxy-glucal hydratase domain-containing protein n=1 Tax=Novipirellula herctigrandis TaxID=2527986 RepID=A0A5C5YN52_9BACT|nr:hypothetical protein CA13_68090 [Planctomycetes bacterium CA13]
MKIAVALVPMLCAALFTSLTTQLRAESPVAQPPENFRSLIVGDSLEGWHGRRTINPMELANMSDEQQAAHREKFVEETNAHWTVENGEIVNDGKGPFLVTNEDFRDFELCIEYKTVAKADSGIYLKGTPQVQIWDHTNAAGFALGADKGSGGLWNNSKGATGKDPLVMADRPFGQWNAFRIVQVGARTSVWLNDQLVVDHAIMENYWDRDSPLIVKGPIELQTHGGEIRWRNISIREFTDEEASQILRSHQSEGFEPIFNGTDLTGWIGAVDDYEVSDGVIKCKPNHGGLLLFGKEYANFVARVDFRLPPGGNNGLAIRSPSKGDTAYAGMCELQVLDTEHPKYKGLDPRQAHGSAYGMAAARRGYLRDTGKWNTQEVTVNGSRIKVELNGTVTLDTDLSQVTEFLAGRKHPGKDRTSGYFGFAGHNDPVEYRNVAVKVLPDSP